MNSEAEKKEEEIAATEPMESAEPVEPVEPEEAAPPRQKKQRSGGGAAFTAALLALAALGACLFLYQQQEIQKKDLRALQQGVDKLLNVIEQRHQTLLERLNTVTAQQQAQTDARLQQLELQLDDTRSRLGRDRGAWSLAEAEHLVRIAEHGLTLEHDTASAIAALRTAKGRLEAENPKRFAAAITRLDSDISTLSTIQLPDRDVLAKTLSDIAAKVEQLPLAQQAKPTAAVEEGDSAAQNAAESAKRTGWDKIWFDLGKLITIRHEEAIVVQPMMLPPERRYFLQQNLLLKLESARLALLLDDTSAWHANLGDTTNWLQRYFDIEDPAVRDALGKLEQLAALNLVPPLPDLTTTRNLIQRLATQAELALPASRQSDSKTQSSATEIAKPKASKPAEMKASTPSASKPVAQAPATAPQPPRGDAQ